MIGIRDLQLLKDIDILYHNEIILYGAGNIGMKAVKMLSGAGIPVLGFCDSSIEKWGNMVEGHFVFSIHELVTMAKEKALIVIITMANQDQVAQVLTVLERYGLSDINSYTWFALLYTLALHFEDQRINAAFREKMRLKELIFQEFRENEVLKGKAVSALKAVASSDNHILILQPGKVGSTSVVASLRKAFIPCAHIHSITGKGFLFDGGIKGTELLRKVNKVKVISMVRDPIAKSIAHYFQCFNDGIVAHRTTLVLPDTFEGVKALLERERSMGKDGALFEWFNREIKEPFGVDIYAHDFDRERGYQIICEGNVELLLIKMENLDECGDVIGQFVGSRDFRLIRANMGYDKLYRFAYEKLKRTIEIPRHILDFYYKGNKAMDHFYTEEEKQQFFLKWTMGDRIISI